MTSTEQREARPEWSDVAIDAARRLHTTPLPKADGFYNSKTWSLDDWRAVLRVENQNLSKSAKYDAISAFFRVSEARYYQRLHHILDMPEALAWDPILVHRLRDARDRRSAARAARVLIGANPRTTR